MKRLSIVLALALVLVLGLSGRGQDDDKPAKKTYHLTVWVSGLNDTIELDDVKDPKSSTEKGVFETEKGSILYVPQDKILALLLEPMSAKKRAMDDKQPK